MSSVIRGSDNFDSAAKQVTTATSDPTSTTNGSLGDVIVNTTSGEMFVCIDATINANVWNLIGGTITPLSATGGTVTTDGSYTVHTFTSSGTLDVTGSGDAEILVVAGGGSGGGGYWSGGGGGGAGGVAYASAYPLTEGSYAIAVGAGGSSPAGFVVGNNGTNSSIGSIVTAYGGGGGGGYGDDGLNGGSGGGAGADRTTAGTATQGTGTGFTLYGNAGGICQVSWPEGTGGGGGASAAGTDGGTSAGQPGVGGDGIQLSISGSATYYAGGGGGGSNGLAGSGGLGGGGQGYYDANGRGATAGTANTGSGGGGGSASNNPSGYTNINGGSGIVIVRYLTAA